MTHRQKHHLITKLHQDAEIQLSGFTPLADSPVNSIAAPNRFLRPTLRPIMRVEALWLFAVCPPVEALLLVRPAPVLPSRKLWLTVPRQPNTGAIQRSFLCDNTAIRVGYSSVFEEDYDGETSADHHELYWLHTSTQSSDDDDLLWLGDANEDDADSDNDDKDRLGELIGEGKVVLCLPNMASDEECETLFQAAAAQTTKSLVGRSRYSVADPNIFDANIVLTTEEILLRVLDYLDETIPSVYSWLFDPTQNDWASRQPWNAALEQPTVPPDPMLAETCTSLRDLYMQGALEWSEGEPAINIYRGGGYFGAHKDHLALTILIPLTSLDSFEGGGTGFWAGNRLVDENPSTEPSLVLKPPRGTALVFGGDVTHAGMPVDAGIRSVLVCSFSTVTPASRPDRLHGLQAPPQVSANFKGTR